MCRKSRWFPIQSDIRLCIDSGHQGKPLNKPDSNNLRYSKVKFNEVLLAGTTSYTLLGRPFLNNTYVEGVIESISESDKTLVFKKKRRKQYKKSFGSRVKLTSCRITKIVHQLTPETLSQAVSLVDHNLK